MIIKKILKISPYQLLIGIIILFSIFYRLCEWSQFNKFAGDEGIQLITVSHFLADGKLPLGGEISGIDKTSHYILHNSSWGFYFQSLIYVLGLGTPEGYSLVYLIISVFQLILFYKATEFFLSREVALFTFVLMGLSFSFVVWSSWTSQPVNAMFFQAISFYFLSKAYKNKSEIWFWWSTVIGVLSVQFYPPMYLWLPAMIVVFLYGFKALVKDKKSFILKLLLAIGVIYFPLILFEFKTEMMNMTTVMNYLQARGGGSLLSTGYFFENLSKNLFGLVKIFKESLAIYAKLILPVMSFLLAIAWIKNRQIRNKISGLVLSVMVYIILLSIFQSYVNLVYIYSLIPYVFILLGIALTQLGRIWTIILWLSLTAFLLMIGYKFTIRDRNVFQLGELRETVSVINNDCQQRGVGLDSIFLYTISDSDNWDWDGTMYWYLLERLTKFRLVEINSFSSKAERIFSREPEVYYLICSKIPTFLTDEKCKEKFIERSLRERSIFLVEDNKFVFENSSLYVLLPIHLGLPGDGNISSRVNNWLR